MSCKADTSPIIGRHARVVGYVAECACGWRGRDWLTRPAAAQDATAHDARPTQEQGGPDERIVNASAPVQGPAHLPSTRELRDRMRETASGYVEVASKPIPRAKAARPAREAPSVPHVERTPSAPRGTPAVVLHVNVAEVNRAVEEIGRPDLRLPDPPASADRPARRGFVMPVRSGWRSI